MTHDKSSLHLAVFTLTLAASLLVWVELSLSDAVPSSDRHVARRVAPGLAIAVQTPPADAAAPGVRLADVANMAADMNGGDDVLTR